MNTDATGIESSAKVRKPTFRWLSLLVIVILTVSTAWFVVGVYRAVSGRQHALERLYGVQLACDLVAEYVEQSDGEEWPKSWKDLEQLPAREHAMHAWPRDAARIREIVEIDFTAHPHIVAQQTPKAFAAIRSTPGHTDFLFTSEYDLLIDRVREAVNKSKQD